jgi:hypothetical protein
MGKTYKINPKKAGPFMHLWTKKNPGAEPGLKCSFIFGEPNSGNDIWRPE